MSEEPKRRPGRPRLHPEEEALTDRIALRAPPTLRARLDAVAKANNRSLSTEAQFRLERSFVQDDALAGPARRVLQHVLVAFGPDTDPTDRAEYLHAMVKAISALVDNYPGGEMPFEEWKAVMEAVRGRVAHGQLRREGRR